MTRRYRRPILPLAAILLLAALPAAAQVPEPVVLINAFQVDADGNVVEGFDLEIEAKPVVVGAELYDGQVMANRSRLATVLVVSTGDIVTLEALLSKSIAVDLKRKCRCECNGEWFTLPPTTTSKCEALEGKRCEHPPGSPGVLEGCGMSYVKVARMTLEPFDDGSASFPDP